MIPAEDYFHIFYFAVNLDEGSVTVIYRMGIVQPNQTVRYTQSNATVVIDDPDLITPLFMKHRPVLKADLYKLLQDAKKFPAGVIS